MSTIFEQMQLFANNIVSFYNDNKKKKNDNELNVNDISPNMMLNAYRASDKDESLIERYMMLHYDKERNSIALGNNELERIISGFISYARDHKEDLKRERLSDERPVSEETPSGDIDFSDPNLIIKHKKFNEIMEYVRNDEPVFLVGPAGSGKNVICKQVAEELGIPFHFTNAVTQEYKITGFTDAMGKYHESEFFRAFKYGGIFMLDEMDASVPDALVILNAAIANRYFDFPAPIGYVEAHKDFRVIAAGNTFGLGANYEYVGRNQLDAASLDRFAQVEVDYDDRIEMKCALGDEGLVRFIDEFRESSAAAGVHVVVSYRSITRIRKMMERLDLHDVLKSSLAKGLSKDDLHMIIQGMKNSGKYMAALRTIENSL